MKTISVSAGKGVKSKVVSLAKAAKYLAKFLESDSGASEENLGFLKRASGAFNELHAFHKEIKRSTSRLSRGADAADVNVRSRKEVILDDEKKHKKKDKKKDREEGVSHINSSGVKAGGGKREVDGVKRKKLKHGVKEGSLEDSEESNFKKKRKKSREHEE